MCTYNFINSYSEISRECCASNWEENPLKPNVFRNRRTTHIHGTIKKESLNELRYDFFKLFFANIVVLPFKMIGRTVHLLSGDFIREGLTDIQRIREIREQNWSLLQPGFREGTLPARDSQWFNFKTIVKYLIKDIVQIVTLPLATIAAQFACLYGILNPLNGRALYAAIENTWSRRTIWVSTSSSSAMRLFHCIVVDYLAFYMQHDQILVEKNLYRLLNNYNPYTLRSLLVRMINLIEDHFTFFSQEQSLDSSFGLNQENWPDKLLSNLHAYRSKIDLIIGTDAEELDVDGNLLVPLTTKQLAESMKFFLKKKSIQQITEKKELNFGDILWIETHIPEENEEIHRNLKIWKCHIIREKLLSILTRLTSIQRIRKNAVPSAQTDDFSFMDDSSYNIRQEILQIENVTKTLDSYLRGPL